MDVFSCSHALNRPRRSNCHARYVSCLQVSLISMGSQDDPLPTTAQQDALVSCAAVVMQTLRQLGAASAFHPLAQHKTRSWAGNNSTQCRVRLLCFRLRDCRLPRFIERAGDGNRVNPPQLLPTFVFFFQSSFISCLPHLFRRNRLRREAARGTP